MQKARSHRHQQRESKGFKNQKARRGEKNRNDWYTRCRAPGSECTLNRAWRVRAISAFTPSVLHTVTKTKRFSSFLVFLGVARTRKITFRLGRGANPGRWCQMSSSLSFCCCCCPLRCRLLAHPRKLGGVIETPKLG